METVGLTVAKGGWNGSGHISALDDKSRTAEASEWRRQSCQSISATAPRMQGGDAASRFVVTRSLDGCYFW